jgi:hypothetical protein
MLAAAVAAVTPACPQRPALVARAAVALALEQRAARELLGRLTLAAVVAAVAILTRVLEVLAAQA